MVLALRVPSAAFDEVMVRRALALLLDPDRSAYLFALPHAASCVRQGSDLDGLLAALPKLASGAGVYFGLNPSTLEVGSSRHPRNADIACRRWLLIDADPVRPADTNSSDSEHDAARATALAIRDWLASLGWPAPLVNDSGNGWHLLYRIDLPADAAAQGLLRRFLLGVARRFDTAAVAVDPAVFDARRICKLPGTWTRKGPHSPERPHRLARLVEVPDRVEVVSREQIEQALTACEELLETVVDARVEPEVMPPPANGHGKGGGLVLRAPSGGGYGRAALDGEVDKVVAAAPGGRNNQLNLSSFAMGQLVEAGLLDEGDAVAALMAAATVAGLPEQEAERTVRSGMDAGKQNPRKGIDAPPPLPPHEPDLTPRSEPWPAPPAPEAYHGLAGDVVRLIEPETEADPAALLIQFLAHFGNAVGRTGHRLVGSKRHHGNLFCCLVGRTAKGRKGTSLDWITTLFTMAEQDWADNCVQTGLSSGEGLIHAVRDRTTKREAVRVKDQPVTYEEVEQDAGVPDKRLLVIEEEFAAVLRMAARDGNILSAVLRQAWDGDKLRTLTRNNPLRATGVHISVVGHVTRDELVRCLERTDVSNGFANRFLWVAVRRSKLLPDGGGHIDLHDAADKVSQALAHARLVGEMGRTPEAGALWRANYPRLSAERPGALGLVTNRAEAQVLRLAVLYALLDGWDTVDVCHLKAALALWDYCERSCRWVFGERTGDGDADEILDALKAAGETGLAVKDIHALFGRHRTAGKLRQSLAVLLEGGLAHTRTVPRSDGQPGKPAHRWFIGGQAPRT